MLQIVIEEDKIRWFGTCYISVKMLKQAAKICKKFNLTIVEWTGNNDRELVECCFTPMIPEEMADESYEFVEKMSRSQK